jgi:thymidine kinase
MGILDQIDKDKLVCTFCGKQPVVAFTFALDAEIDPTTGNPVNRELVQDSIVATCKDHVSILQEQFEKELRDADYVGELDEDSDE